MKLYRLDEAQVLPVSVEEAWAFFSDPHNLEIITPPWLNLVVEADVPHEIYPGLLIAYRVSPLMGLRTDWITEITHVIPGRLFVDEQRFGPYRMWHHEHHFRAVEGGTEVRDRISYILPYRLAGQAIAARFVERQLAGIFSYRRRVVGDRMNDERGTMNGGRDEG